MIETCKCGNSFYKHNTLQKLCPKCQFTKALKKEYKDKGIEKKRPYNWSGEKRTKKKSQSTLEKEKADLWFSLYIRLKYAFKSGNELYCKCFTCGSMHPIKMIDNGHFVTRGNLSVRYHENNARPQCRSENRFKQGVHSVFRDKLIAEIGKDEVEKVEQLQSLGLTEQQAIKIMQPDYCGRIGFASYSLTNNSANIRSTQQRIEQLRKQQQQETK